MLAPYEAGAPSRLRRLVTSSTILFGLLSITAAPPVRAQEEQEDQEEHPPIYAWAETGGKVELSRSITADTGMPSLDLTIREGESATYYLRLSKQPEASGWWVRVHVDGYVRYDGDLIKDGKEQSIPLLGAVGRLAGRPGRQQRESNALAAASRYVPRTTTTLTTSS